MKIYAFDVDHTLEVSEGPVTLASMMDLRVHGHIVGLCGNWGVFLAKVPGWQHLISFFNYGSSDKAAFLADMMNRVPAEEYVLVGNVGPVCAKVFEIGQTGGSNDLLAARLSGWKFIVEHDFAKGAR